MFSRDHHGPLINTYYFFLDYNGDLKSEDYQFLIATFWILVYDLPLGKRTRETTEKVGRQLGNLVVIDYGLESNDWPRFLTIRVEITVAKPLRRAIIIGGARGQGIRGRLCYERLPIFCYFCGMLGHYEDFCEAKKENGRAEESTQQYGDWLIASPLKMPRGSGVRSSSSSINMVVKKNLQSSQMDFAIRKKLTEPIQQNFSSDEGFGVGME